MALSTTATAQDPGRPRGLGGLAIAPARTLSSAVSWGAIFAGAAAAAALSLILLILGVGLGLSSVSPWAWDGISATALGVSTILWLTLTQLLVSAMGGYLTGRLRTRWTDVHTDEVYFRDTAHGFLAWAVATLTTATLLTSVIAAIVGGGVQASAQVVGGVVSTASSAAASAAGPTRMAQGNTDSPMGYFVDSLFRRGAATAAASTGAEVAPPNTEARARVSASDTAEVGRIFMHVSLSEPLPPEDVRYVGQIVAQRTGLSPPDAERRVVEVYAKAQAQVRNAELAARDAADKARKTSAHSALWLFVSLLVGAFVASLAATFGGRRRDA